MVFPDITHHSLKALVALIGYPGLFAIIFAESGLFFGFFLPGSSMLFTAGILASQGYFNIWILAFGALCAAVLGDNVGYWTGLKVGRTFFQRPDSRFFKHEHLMAAERFYEKYGGRAVFLARFVPIVRTCASIVAGIAKMQYYTFLAYNILGGIVWAAGTCIAGYYMGTHIPWISQYMNHIIILIILASIIPAVWEPIKKSYAKKDNAPN